MKILAPLILFIFPAFFCVAQHHYPEYVYPDSIIVNAASVATQSKVFINVKLRKINRYVDKESRNTQQLLKKLSRKETRYLRKVKRKDTLAELQMGKSISFDSISKIAQSTDAGKTYKKTQGGFNKTLDSLKGIADFANQKISRAKAKLKQNDLQGLNTDEIDELQDKLNVNQYVQQQIQIRNSSLQSIGKASNYTKGLGGVAKQTYYYKQKLNSYKNIANDPSVLEEKALEYLSGMEGFEKSVNVNAPGANNGQSMQQAKNAEELEQMGFQTKRQVNAKIGQQFGMKTPEQLEKVNSKFKEAKSQFTNYTTQLNNTRSQIKKLGFKPNPLRGMPMKDRLEKSINWQMSKVSNLSSTIIEINGLLGFKHTPTWTHSLVAGGGR